MTGVEEVWRGAVNSWQCDHLGHLNTRFYLALVEQGLSVLRRGWGPTGRNGLLIRDQHMRFLREARVGDALYLEAGVTAVNGARVQVALVLRHAGQGDVCAAFTLDGDREGDAPLGWLSPAWDPPPEAAPRSLPADDRSWTVDETRARRTGLALIGPDQIAADGRLRPSVLMGLIADAVPHMPRSDWRAVLKETSPGVERIASALVEFRTHHEAWPRAGDLCEVLSTTDGCSDRATFSRHWLRNADTGAFYAGVRTAGIAMDLDARKVLKLTPEAQAAYA